MTQLKGSVIQMKRLFRICLFSVLGSRSSFPKLILLESKQIFSELCCALHHVCFISRKDEALLSKCDMGSPLSYIYRKRDHLTSQPARRKSANLDMATK